MKIIKTKLFDKWANKNEVNYESLLKAAKETISQNEEKAIKIVAKSLLIRMKKSFD